MGSPVLPHAEADAVPPSPAAPSMEEVVVRVVQMLSAIAAEAVLKALGEPGKRRDERAEDLRTRLERVLLADGCRAAQDLVWAICPDAASHETTMDDIFADGQQDPADPEEAAAAYMDDVFGDISD